MKKIKKYIVSVIILLASFSSIGIPFASADSPDVPSGPYPAMSSTGVTIFIDLHWAVVETGLMYDVYFGADAEPPLASTHQTTAFYDPGALTFNTTYYWQIVAFNSVEESTPGPIWSFSTAMDIAPYHAMILTGPTSAGKEISLNFTAIAADPEGDQVYYQWDWDNGNLSSWLGPYTFGQYSTTSYRWMQNGSYNVRVRAKDPSGEISEWSAAYPVDIQSQIHFTTLRSGSVLFNAFGIDLAYGYFAFMDKLGASLIISNQDFSINATISENVYRVVFSMQNLVFPDIVWTSEDENISGKSYGYFSLDTGIYMAKAYAYDIHGNLIDKTPGEYVIYHQYQFRIVKALASLLGRKG